MAYSAVQHTLRARVAACDTAAAIHALLDAAPPANETQWKHVAKAARAFDAALIDRLFAHYDCIAIMARNRAMTPAHLAHLHERIAATPEHPAMFQTMRTAASTGRLRAAHAATARLVTYALGPGEDPAAPPKHLGAALYVLKSVRDLTLDVRIRLAERALTAQGSGYYAQDLLQGHLPLHQFRAVVAPLVARAPDAAMDALLAQATPAALATLTRDDLAPCLRSTTAKTRQRAATMLHHARGEVPPPPPPAPAAARRRRR